ncbi:MAG: hypothetical protein HY675_28710 [Chloroflexi bacterium]|nr:hypothetical protein [Chloroflexota bacterium]
MAISFDKDILEVQLLNPMKNFALDTKITEVRRDPLTGRTSRIVDRFGPPPTPHDFSDLIDKTRNCFFCPDKVETLTPRIRPEISSEERIKVGQAILFPNLMAYGKYSGVSIFSGEHFVPLGDFTAELIYNNLKASQRYIQLVAAYDSSVRYCSINGNYLFPAGSSMPHPHLQSCIDPFPTNVQAEMLSCSQRYCEHYGSHFWHDLIQAEREREERYIGAIGNTVWLTSYAPIGFNEVRAVVVGQSSLSALKPEDIEDIGEGLVRVLRFYSDQGFNSFNLAIYSGPLSGCEDYWVNLRLVSRSNLEPYYRSDATYFERLHWESMTDKKPEDVCLGLRPYFSTRL